MIVLLAALVFASLFPGCKPQQPQAPAGRVGSGGGPAVPAPTKPGTHTEGGYLAGPRDSYGFSVDSPGTYLEVPFTYPKGSVDFWVEVVDRDGHTVLGDFSLDRDGEIIMLMGKGPFYLTIYSNSGAGNWSCYW